jgi:sugar lactone lactonase YvrE
MEYLARTLAGGFIYPEGPRWHDGRLWFADQHAGEVVVLAPDGRETDRFAVPGNPSGMGWLPDGDLLVVSMHERRLYRRHDGRLRAVAELAALHPFHSNDMVVDGTGRAYVGNIGFNFYAGEEPRPTSLALVHPDGRVEQAADGLLVPNGTVVTADGRLIIAESFANRLTCFDIAADGRLSGRRVFAQLDGHVPDGICLDAEGCVWAASCYAGQAIRVAEGGRILDSVRVPVGNAFACMLGGADGRDLFLCCATEHDPARTRAARAGRIDIARVAVPRAGWP